MTALLSSGSRKSKDRALALCDALDIARCSTETSGDFVQREAPSRLIPPTTPTPPWMDGGVNSIRASKNEKTGIILNSEAFGKISKLSDRTTAKVYRSFFERIYREARTKKLVPQRSIIYGTMTPPWLRNGTVFFGSISNETLALYSETELPTGTEAGRKFSTVAAAILFSWLYLEKETSGLLRDCFRNCAVPIDEIAGLVETEGPEIMEENELEVERALPAPSPVFTRHSIHIYRTDIASLLGTAKLNDHIPNAFFSILSEPDGRLHIEDTGFHTVLEEASGGERVNKWFRGKWAERR